MFFELSCKITIANNYVLRGVHEVEIKKSIHTLVDTAKVQLPMSVVMRNNNLLQRIRLADKINAGDSIVVELGYNDVLVKEFEGYILRRNHKDLFELECEDGLYLFRKVFYKNSWKSIALKTLLNYLLDGYEKKYGVRLELYSQIPDVTLSNFFINDGSGIAVLQALKDTYGLHSYLTTINSKKVLYCGLLYLHDKATVGYVVNRNTTSVDDLKFDQSGDRQFKVKVINFNRDGTKRTLEVGDKDGELRTLYFYDTHDENQLKQMAMAELEKFRTDGYKGGFETFLIPFCEPGMIAAIEDPQFTSRKGSYYTSTVTTSFGAAGGRRKPEIDIKVSA